MVSRVPWWEPLATVYEILFEDTNLRFSSCPPQTSLVYRTDKTEHWRRIQWPLRTRNSEEIRRGGMRMCVPVCRNYAIIGVGVWYAWRHVNSLLYQCGCCRCCHDDDRQQTVNAGDVLRHVAALYRPTRSCWCISMEGRSGRITRVD